MSDQTDLLNYIEAKKYPEAAGFKQHTTSKAAAMRMDEDTFKGWSYLVIADQLARIPSTVKETLAHLHNRYPVRMQGRDVNSLRPRFSELKQLKRISESGARRNGEAVWMMTPRH